jgi:repressor LexA
MATIAERMRAAMDQRGISQADIVNHTGIGKSSISTYLTGEYEPKQRNLHKIAEALDVDPGWLMGLDVPMKQNVQNSPAESTLPYNLLPIRRKRIPLLGTIAAGVPIFADEDLETDIAVDYDVKCDFALKVTGDSMVNARIQDGDIVFIRDQPDVNDSEIAAVIVDDSATLKRVYHIPGGVMLASENPKYAPMMFTQENSTSVRIIGKVVAFQSYV